MLPALAIGRALVDRGHPASSIHFVGSRRGIEGRLVPDAGFDVTLLPGRGVARRLSLANVGAVAGLVAAMGRSLALVARRRPAVIVSVGGYASVGCVLASAVLRVPLVVAEQNAVPGAANRLAARVAKAVAVSFAAHPPAPSCRDRQPGPCRRSWRSMARPSTGPRPAAPWTCRRTRTVIVAFGGSLGAWHINQSVVALAEMWRDRPRLALYHIVGDRDWEAVRAVAPAPSPNGLSYQQVRYQDHMELVYAAADVAICRAGATTVAELAVVGLPSVLVPLPGATHDHQTANARALVDVGAALLVPDAEATPERLAAELQPLLDDPAALATMAAAARSAAHRDAAAAVAALVEQVSRD